MARETNTRELVREIALAALDRGEKPTQAMVRKVILEEHGRTASPNLVMNELNAVMVSAASVNAKRFSLPDVPGAVSEALTNVWAVACEQATVVVEDKIQDVCRREAAAEQSVRAVESQLAIEKTTVTTLTHDLDLLKQTLQSKTDLIVDLQNTLKESALRLDAASERLLNMTSDKVRFEAAAILRVTEIEANNRQELERLRNEHEKAIEKMAVLHQQDAQTWEGLRKHLLNQTDQIRQAAKNNEETQRLRIADLEIRDGILTRKSNEVQDELSKLRGATDVMRSQIARLESSERSANASLLRTEIFAKTKMSEIDKWIAEKNPDLHSAFKMMFGDVFK